jgi:ABC-type branched-subunit amino acid transport system ATPase component
VLAFVLLTVFALGVGPVIGFGVGGFVLILCMRVAVPAFARAEEGAVLAAEGLPADTPLAPAVQPRLLPTASRLIRRRGIQDLAALAVAIGCAALVVPLFGGRILMRDLSLNNWQRFAVLGSVAFAALVCGPVAAWLLGRVVGAREVDRKLAAIGTGACCVLVGLAGFMPWLWVFVVLLFLGESCVYAIARSVVRCVADTVSARERPAAWWLLLIYAELVGALVGGILLDLVAARESPRWSLVLVAPLGLAVAGWVLATVNRGSSVRESADIVASVRERRFAQERADKGIPPPAVEIVGLDFSYGTQPVLRGVSLAVEQGEVAALLGTNGAGKSTLLRVISGLSAPERGMVRLFGEPAGLLTTEELASRGISLVLGGGMTFPGLTVAETVRLTGIGLDNPADVDEIYGRFPVLWHRRNQRTGTLSGGEQQMLALGRALLTRPRLLLIDELTLGLAPKIVGELVQLVEEINEQGTTVLLVEQSVNVATGIAWHAFFLERGEIRYDGPTHELLERDDLLRSVFLASADL